ncbi:pleckstrin homology domain-containing protein 1 [Phtheirospermum japonicum]|uniref:Pleckstrin homology domain-containing protein 1 n=1 Tax=Phtheirospermum japonicum TaxID=374723 RepID=A0A830B6K8_9LAMI|nr:pleckstrin homology domain-containing protein 1 [Phtheirospermum japonicum]
MGSVQVGVDNYDGMEFWGPPERAVWLTKQGDYIKTWRRRWFILKQGKVFCFKESTVTRASMPRGIISVANCLTVKGADDVLLRQNLGRYSLSEFPTSYILGEFSRAKTSLAHPCKKI